MSQILASGRAKLARAKFHRDTLRREIAAFLDSKPYPVRCEVDEERSQYRFRVSIDKLPPEAEWGLIIGDCVHAARSALDHSIWGLAEISGSDWSDETTQFVVADDEEKFRRARFRIQRLPERLQTIVEDEQPYRSHPRPTLDPLCWLRDLDNRDKHKVISVTTCTNFSPSAADT